MCIRTLVDDHQFLSFSKFFFWNIFDCVDRFRKYELKKDSCWECRRKFSLLVALEVQEVALMGKEWVLAGGTRKPLLRAHRMLSAGTQDALCSLSLTSEGKITAAIDWPSSVEVTLCRKRLLLFRNYLSLYSFISILLLIDRNALILFWFQRGRNSQKQRRVQFCNI